MSSAVSQPYFLRAVTWKGTQDPMTPWMARVDDADWILRLGEFPDQDMYALLVNGKEAASFNDWPKAWTKEGAATSPNAVQPPSSAQEVLQKRVAALERKVGALSKQLGSVGGGRAKVKVYGRKIKTPKASRSGR